MAFNMGVIRAAAVAAEGDVDIVARLAPFAGGPDTSHCLSVR